MILSLTIVALRLFDQPQGKKWGFIFWSGVERGRNVCLLEVFPCDESGRKLESFPHFYHNGIHVGLHELESAMINRPIN